MSIRKFLTAGLRAVILAALLGGGLLLATRASAAPYENPDEGVFADKIKIGAFLPLSGTLASMGQAVNEGLHVYLEKVNQAGGVHGRKIEAIIYDDEYKPAQSVANSKLLVERDKVFALVSPLGTATSLAAYEYLAPRKIPMVGVLSISDMVTDPPREYLFALPAPQSTETPAYVEYAISKLKAKRFAILYQNDSWGQPSLKFAEKQLAKHGLKLVEVQTFERLTSDMTSQVFKLKESNPDVVILYALGQQAALFFKTAQKLGWSPTVFGAGGLNDPKTIELVGDIANDHLYVASYYWPLDSGRPEIQDYVTRYKKMYPKANIGMLGLMGYSAGVVFVEALREAGPEPTRAKLMAALDKMHNFDQKIGPPITFQDTNAGVYSRRGQTALVIVKLQDMKFQALGDFIDPVSR